MAVDCLDSRELSEQKRKPRVETHSPFDVSYGPEAIELMRRAGKRMDPWQQDGITLMLGVRPDGRWAHFEYCEWCARQNGKGVVLEARVLAGLLLLGEQLIMWSAHQYKTAMEAFRRVLKLLAKLGTKVTDTLYVVDGDEGPIRIKVINANGEEGLERLDTGQRLRFIARSEQSGRGFTGDVNIIDEAFAYTPEMHEALLFTMSAVENPQIIYTSTPPLRGDLGEVMFNLRERGDPTLPRADDEQPWELEDGLCYRDWGAGGDLDDLDGIDLDDVELWRFTNPAMGYRITIEFTRKERRSMGAVGFARERLGIWPKRIRIEVVRGPITEDEWGRLGPQPDQPIPERPADVAFAIHVNLTRTRAVIGWAGRREDGTYLVGLADWRAGTAWLVGRVLDLRDRWDPIGIGVDTRSESVLLDLENADLRVPEDPEHPKRGELAIPTAANVAQAYGMFLDAVRHGRLRHLGEGPLTTAVVGCGTRPLSGGQTWDYRGPIEAGTAAACTLALWTLLTRIDKVIEEYDTVGDVW